MPEPWEGKHILRDLDGTPIPQKWDAALGSFVPATEMVKITGSSMELFGATVATRPAANSVAVGTTFLAIDTFQVTISNGVNWVVV